MTLLFSICLGGVAVLQGALNKQIFPKWGVVPAIVLNNVVIFSAGLLLYGIVKWLPEKFPENYILSGQFSQPQWWYFLPGLLGLCLVGGVPLAMSRLGAAKVFIAVVMGQMIVSLIWDVVREGIPLTWPRVLAAVMSVGAVALMNWES